MLVWTASSEISQRATQGCGKRVAYRVGIGLYLADATCSDQSGGGGGGGGDRLVTDSPAYWVCLAETIGARVQMGFPIDATTINWAVAAMSSVYSSRLLIEWQTNSVRRKASRQNPPPNPREALPRSA